MRVSVDFKHFKPRNEFVDQMMGVISKWEQQFTHKGECRITISEQQKMFNFDFEFSASDIDSGQSCGVKIRKSDMHGMPRDWMIFVLVVYMDYITANFMRGTGRAESTKTHHYTH